MYGDGGRGRRLLGDDDGPVAKDRTDRSQPAME
jgi:hypothetical protein